MLSLLFGRGDEISVLSVDDDDDRLDVLTSPLNERWRSRSKGEASSSGISDIGGDFTGCEGTLEGSESTEKILVRGFGMGLHRKGSNDSINYWNTLGQGSYNHETRELY